MKIILRYIIQQSAALLLIVCLLSNHLPTVNPIHSYSPDSEKAYSVIIETSLQTINLNNSFKKDHKENNYAGGYLSKIILVNENSRSRVKLFSDIIYRNNSESLRIKNFLSAHFSTSV